MPGRLQRRTSHLMPKGAPLLPGEPYPAVQRCSSPPASHCNTTMKKLKSVAVKANVCCHSLNSLGSQTFAGMGFVPPRRMGVQSPAHMAITGCFDWRYLSQPSAWWRLPPTVLLAALQQTAVFLHYHISTLQA